MNWRHLVLVVVLLAVIALTILFPTDMQGAFHHYSVFDDPTLAIPKAVRHGATLSPYPPNEVLQINWVTTQIALALGAFMLLLRGRWAMCARHQVVVWAWMLLMVLGGIYITWYEIPISSPLPFYVRLGVDAPFAINSILLTLMLLVTLSPDANAAERRISRIFLAFFILLIVGVYCLIGFQPYVKRFVTPEVAVMYGFSVMWLLAGSLLFAFHGKPAGAESHEGEHPEAPHAEEALASAPCECAAGECTAHAEAKPGS